MYSISTIAATGFLVLSVGTLYRTHTKRMELQAVKMELDLLGTEKFVHKSQKLTQKSQPTEVIYDCPAPETISQQKIQDYEKEEQKSSNKQSSDSFSSGKKYKELEKPPIKDVVEGLPPIVEDYLAITDWEQEWKNRLFRHKKVCEKFPEKTPIFDQWMANGPEKQRDSYSLGKRHKSNWLRFLSQNSRYLKRGGRGPFFLAKIRETENSEEIDFPNIEKRSFMV